jgi:Fe-S-cluster containining protein
VWHYVGGRGRAIDRCRRHRNEPISPLAAACPAFTASLDCQTCGACCREAYHSVELGPRDPFVRRHPEHVVLRDGRLQMPRDTGRCSCLGGEPGAWSCIVYADRPKTCRDFPVGETSCVEARRRVGLTP